MAGLDLCGLRASMDNINVRKIWIIIFLLSFSVLASACEETIIISDPLLPVEYAVDPAFREFYELLGGRAVLGPPISPLFMYKNVKYQYTQAVLLVSDPDPGINQKYRLAALGLDMGIIEPAVPRPDEEHVRYVDGHIVYEMFVPLYERLGGLRIVGRPLTEVHYNPTKGRYEQYFENLGMYWIEGDPADEIYLLAYGAWKCDASCRHQSPENATIVLPYRVDEIFREIVSRLGADFTGFALTDAYQTPDGYLEQVFENIVLVQDMSRPGQIFLREITGIVGIEPEPLQSQINKPGFEFYSIQGGLGQFVPEIFWKYLAKHGGLEASGAPISAFSQWKADIRRQCFMNICLEESQDFDGSIRVRPSPLGYTYRLLPVSPVGKNNPPAEYPPPAQIPDQSDDGKSLQEPAVPVPQPTIDTYTNSQIGELSMQVWESYPMVSSDQSQEIGVSLFQDNLPLINIEPDLIVTLPDGRNKTYYMYPTGADGQVRMVLDPIDAPNGTLIPYQVCIYNLNHEKFCVRDSFLIWQNP